MKSIKNKVWFQVWDKILDQVEKQVSKQVWNQGWDQVWGEVRKEFWNHPSDLVKDRSVNQVENRHEFY